MTQPAVHVVSAWRSIVYIYFLIAAGIARSSQLSSSYLGRQYEPFITVKITPFGPLFFSRAGQDSVLGHFSKAFGLGNKKYSPRYKLCLPGHCQTYSQWTCWAIPLVSAREDGTCHCSDFGRLLLGSSNCHWGLALHGVLPSLAWGEWPGKCLYCDRQSIPQPLPDCTLASDFPRSLCFMWFWFGLEILRLVKKIIFLKYWMVSIIFDLLTSEKIAPFLIRKLISSKFAAKGIKRTKILRWFQKSVELFGQEVTKDFFSVPKKSNFL